MPEYPRAELIDMSMLGTVAVAVILISGAFFLGWIMSMIHDARD